MDGTTRPGAATAEPPAGAAATTARSDGPDPLWSRAMADIEEQIRSGALEPGTRLAPERDLCQQMGVSRVTLRKALGALVERGYLRASHGRGWFVAGPAPRGEWPNALESFTETARRMGLRATSRVTWSGVVPASLDVAETLRVAPGTPLFDVERVRLLDDVPIALDRTTLPHALVPGIEDADLATASLYALLSEHGVEPVRAESTIEARAADAGLAQLLGIAEGAPVLVLDQVAVDGAGRPLLASVVRYSGERYRLRTVFARTPAAAITARSRG